MRARNIRFRLYSQPQLCHHCRKCFCIFNGRKVWVIVIDGVTVGFPCCAVHNCFIPLSNNHHRFCLIHASHAFICAIVGCTNPIQQESLACAKPSHQEVEHIHRERGQAQFQLKECLQRSQVAHPNDAVAEERDLTDFIDEEEEDFDVGTDGAAHQEQSNQPPATNPKPKKIRAQFGRKRTHNEQIIVCPCGIILARETFYGTEGVASVVVCAICIPEAAAVNVPQPGNDQAYISRRYQTGPHIFR
jgi:hypothetical protein